MGDTTRNERVAVDYTVNLTQQNSSEERGSALKTVESPAERELQKRIRVNKAKNVLTVATMIVLLSAMAVTAGIAIFMLFNAYKKIGAKAIAATVAITLTMGALAVILAIEGVSIMLKSAELGHALTRAVKRERVRHSALMGGNTELDATPALVEQASGIVGVGKLSQEFPKAVPGRGAHTQESSDVGIEQGSATAATPRTSPQSSRRSGMENAAPMYDAGEADYSKGATPKNGSRTVSSIAQERRVNYQGSPLSEQDTATLDQVDTHANARDTLDDGKSVGRIDLPQGFATIYARRLGSQEILTNRVRVYMKVDRRSLESNIYLERRIRKSIEDNRLRITHNKSENSFHLSLGVDRLEIKNLYIFTMGQEPSGRVLMDIFDTHKSCRKPINP